MSNMDTDTKKYYEDLFDTFARPGWKTVIENLEEERRRIDTVANVKDENSLMYVKGQLDLIDQILNLEAGVRYVYDNQDNVEDEGNEAS